MKNYFIILLALFCNIFIVNFCKASSTVIIKVQTTELAQNLDLVAVSDIFAETVSIAEFEKTLNNKSVSNLDLNNDGEIDYLRCIESKNNNTYYIIIQAVLAEDIYQDIATIEVEKDYSGNITTQIIGDSYIYGQHYIIIPTYKYQPVIYSYMWRPNYVCYHSPYYWKHYPHYYQPKYRPNTYHRENPPINRQNPIVNRPNNRSQQSSGKDHRSTRVISTQRQSGVQQRQVTTIQTKTTQKTQMPSRVNRSLQNASRTRTIKTISNTNSARQNASNASTRHSTNIQTNNSAVRTSIRVNANNSNNINRTSGTQQRQSGSYRR